MSLFKAWPLFSAFKIVLRGEHTLGKCAAAEQHPQPVWSLLLLRQGFIMFLNLISTGDPRSASLAAEVAHLCRRAASLAVFKSTCSWTCSPVISATVESEVEGHEFKASLGFRTAPLTSWSTTAASNFCHHLSKSYLSKFSFKFS